jgi:hypothetical protein
MKGIEMKELRGRICTIDARTIVNNNGKQVYAFLKKFEFMCFDEHTNDGEEDESSPLQRERYENILNSIHEDGKTSYLRIDEDESAFGYDALSNTVKVGEQTYKFAGSNITLIGDFLVATNEVNGITEGVKILLESSINPLPYEEDYGKDYGKEPILISTSSKPTSKHVRINPNKKTSFVASVPSSVRYVRGDGELVLESMGKNVSIPISTVDIPSDTIVWDTNPAIIGGVHSGQKGLVIGTGDDGTLCSPEQSRPIIEAMQQYGCRTSVNKGGYERTTIIFKNNYTKLKVVDEDDEYLYVKADKELLALECPSHTIFMRQHYEAFGILGVIYHGLDVDDEDEDDISRKRLIEAIEK